MAVINYNDYLDFPALTAAIKELENNNKQFGAVTQDVFKGIKTNVDGVVKSLRENLTLIQNYNVNQRNAAQGINDISKSTDTLIQKQQQYEQVTKGLNTLSEQLAKNNIILNGTVEKIQKEFSELSDTEEKDIQRKKELITISNVLATAITKYNTTISGTISSYDSLQKNYKEAIANAKNLAAQYGIDSKEALAAADAAKVYADQLANINNLVKQKPKQIITEVVPTVVNNADTSNATGTVVSDAEIAATNEQLGATRALNIEKEKSIPIAEENIAANEQDAATSKLLAEAKDKLAFALSEANVQLRGYALQTKEANKAADLEAKSALGLVGAYERLVSESEAAKVEAKQLGAQYGSTSQQFKLAAANANLLDKEVKAIDAGVGNFQKNVGNYAGGITKAFSGIFSYVRQIAYILPGIGIAGIFSAAFDIISKFASQLFEVNKQVTQFAESQGILNTTLSSGNSEVATATKNVFELKENIQLAKEGFLNKNEVLKQYNDTIGKTTGQVKDLNEAETELNKNADAYIKFTLFKSAANIALEQSAQKLVEAENIRIKSLKDFEKFSDNFQDADAARFQTAEDIARREKAIDDDRKKRQQEQIKVAQDASTQEQKIAADFQKKAAEIFKQFDFKGSFFGTPEENKKAADDIFNYNKELLQNQIKDLQDFVNNGSVLFNERYQAAKDESDKEKLLSDLILQQDLKNGKLRVLAELENTQRIEAANEKLSANLQKINQDRNKNPFPDLPITAPVDNTEAQLAAHAQFIDKLIKQIEEGGKAIEVSNSINQQAEIQANDDLYEAGLIKRKDYEQSKIDIAKKYQLLDLQIQLATQKSILATETEGTNEYDETLNKILQLENFISGLKNASNDASKDIEKVFSELYKNINALSNIAGNNVANFFSNLTGTITSFLEDDSKAFKDHIDEIGQSAISLGYAVIDELNQADENRISQLEKNKNRELTLAGNNAAAQQAITERYAKEEAKLKRKEAVNNKIGALFEIAINTAIGISNAASKVVTIPLIPFILGLGLAEAAVVLAQPLPQYEKGISYAPEGYAVVDEKGTELIVDRHGNLKEVGADSGPRITYLNAGDKVYTASQTREFLTKHIVDKQDEFNIMREMNLHANLSARIQQGRRAEAVQNMTEAFKSSGINRAVLVDAFRDAVKDIPVFQTIFDENGIQEREKRRNALIAHRNTYNFSFKRNKN